MVHLSKRIVIAGGSGSVGRALIAHLNAHDYLCTVLSRSSKHVEGAHRSVAWMNGANDWKAELEGAFAVINLCGEPIAQRWTDKAKLSILESRVEPTKALGLAISAAVNPPRMWINASAIGIYGDTGQEVRTEESPPGSGFMAETCKSWEAAFHQSPPSPVKKAIVRIGVVLESESGYLSTLSKLTKKGFGGRIGKGEQWVSWIHIEDLCAAFRTIVEEEWEGTYNGCGPNPVQQKEMSALLVRTLDVPLAPPAPEFAVRLGCTAMGLDPSLVLASSRILPNELLGAGFEFKFETVQDALKDLL